MVGFTRRGQWIQGSMGWWGSDYLTHRALREDGLGHHAREREHGEAAVCDLLKLVVLGG